MTYFLPYFPRRLYPFSPDGPGKVGIFLDQDGELKAGEEAWWGWAWALTRPALSSRWFLLPRFRLSFSTCYGDPHPSTISLPGGYFSRTVKALGFFIQGPFLLVLCLQ